MLSIPQPDIDRPASQLQPVHAPCKPGSYPWDFWETRAIEAGLPEELAILGRAVMREAHQHNWNPHLQAECGWLDNGEQMLELATSEPHKAKKRWEHLLETDGEIGQYNPESGTFELF